MQVTQHCFEFKEAKMGWESNSDRGNKKYMHKSVEKHNGKQSPMNMNTYRV
jgi:hypothetical protein